MTKTKAVPKKAPTMMKRKAVKTTAPVFAAPKNKSKPKVYNAKKYESARRKIFNLN